MKGLLRREFVLIALAIVTAVLAFPGQGVLAEDKVNFVDAPGSPIEVKGAWYGTIGDFNEDGHQDIAVLCPLYYAEIAGKCCGYVEGGTAAVAILLGNGDGTFTGPTYFPVGDGSWNSNEIATGDLNHDGHLDLVLTNPGTGEYQRGAVGVYTLLGKGDGTFTSAGFSRTGIDPIGIAVGDFNEDGNLDVAVACWNEVSILLGDGKGGFGKNRPIKLPLNTQPVRVIAADLNEDGHLDMATANYGAGEEPSVSVFLGDGNGNFAKGRFYRIVKHPDALAVADFNEDGHLDIAATNLAKEVKPWVFKGYVSLLYGDGTGGFAGPTNVDTGITDPYRMAVADFNGDGHLDLVLANGNTDDVSLLLGDGKGSFHPALQSPFTFVGAGWGGFFWLGTADFDEDGHADLCILDTIDGVIIKLNREEREGK